MYNDVQSDARCGLVKTMRQQCAADSSVLCDRMYVMDFIRSDGGDARCRFGLRFRLLSYVGVFSVTAPSCGFSEI